MKNSVPLNVSALPSEVTKYRPETVSNLKSSARGAFDIEQPDSEAKIPVDPSIVLMILYEPSGIGAAEMYFAVKSYFAVHLLLDCVVTLDTAVKSALTPHAFHCRWLIA